MEGSWMSWLQSTVGGVGINEVEEAIKVIVPH